MGESINKTNISESTSYFSLVFPVNRYFCIILINYLTINYVLLSTEFMKQNEGGKY